MRFTYDKKVKCGYLYFKEDKAAKTLKFSRFLNVDLNKKGHLVGVEFLHISLPAFLVSSFISKTTSGF
ncbi:MAG: DUF2283 domain-containing protein [Candidatus Pacebacteria bacterium]|nr:DUF2283 domain-containing protein [Candidatus Paceibacterota bacterium]